MRSTIAWALLLLTPAALAESSALLMTGELEAREGQRFVTPATTAWRLQLAWLIEEGSLVEAGDVIARFDPGRVQEELTEAEDKLREKEQERRVLEADGRLSALQLEIEELRARIELEKAKLDAALPDGVVEGSDLRQRKLELARKKKAFDDASLSRRVQEAQQLAQRVKLELESKTLTGDIERYRRELDSLVLRADAPGIVVHATHWNGEKIKVGDTRHVGEAIAQIPDLATLEVIAWVAEPDLARVRVGDESRLSLDAFPKRAYRGEVLEVTLNGEQRRPWGRAPFFRVRMRLEEVDIDLMRPGMSVRCIVEEPGGAS